MTTGKFVLLVAFVSALTPPPAVHAQAKQTTATGPSGASAMLKQDMRKLWTDHVVWTRDYIIAATERQPDAPAALNRLLKNQEDIGSAVAKYYGGAAGSQLTTLLKDHIAIAGDIVKAAMANDKTGQKAANPNWPRATLLEMMNTHLSTTATELVARLNKDWVGDVKAFDAVYDHILHMSDALSDGIVKQFPDKFRNAVNTFN
jgi:hypothetical protein